MFQAEGTFEMLLSNQFLNIMFLNILTDVRPLVHLVDPMSCMSGERELGRKLAIRDTGLQEGAELTRIPLGCVSVTSCFVASKNA